MKLEHCECHDYFVFLFASQRATVRFRLQGYFIVWRASGFSRLVEQFFGGTILKAQNMNLLCQSAMVSKWFLAKVAKTESAWKWSTTWALETAQNKTCSGTACPSIKTSGPCLNWHCFARGIHQTTYWNPAAYMMLPSVIFLHNSLSPRRLLNKVHAICHGFALAFFAVFAILISFVECSILINCVVCWYKQRWKRMQ